MDIARAVERAGCLTEGALGAPSDAFVQAEHVGGFNRTWGLPLPQAMAVRHGSVLVFEPSANDLSGLAKAVESGIGERRIDGFGRIAVNFHESSSRRNWAGSLEVPPVQRDKQDSVQIKSTDGDAYELAKKMSERLLRRDLDSWLVEHVGKTELTNATGKPNPPITNHQLARIRRVLLDEISADPSGDSCETTCYLNKLLQGESPDGDTDRNARRRPVVRETALKQLRGTMIRPPEGQALELLKWLEDWKAIGKDANEADVPFMRFLNAAKKRLKCVTETNQSYVSVGGVWAPVPVPLRRLYTLLYLDGVLAKKMKEVRDKGDNS